MKFKKGLSLILFVFALFFTLGSTLGVDAATTVIKKSDGTDLTYRNSSEKVLRLEEYTYPTQDFRAVWVSQFVGDFPSYKSSGSFSVNKFKNDTKDLLDTVESYGINAIIFHIRTHNDAMYDSTLNPRSQYWASVTFDAMDPLTYLIEEAHKRGIEFHAWLNPYRVVSSGLSVSVEEYASNYRSNNPNFPNNPAANASMLLRNGASGLIMNPGEPVVRNHIYATIQEIIDKYDVDAIHFDDYFYNSVADSEDATTYAKAGYNPKNLSKANWRRDQVNILMAGIDSLLDDHFDSTGKVVQLGISPTGIYQNAPAGTAGQEHYSALYCDSMAWVQNEWIDYLLPQTYWGLEHAVAGYAQLTRYWSFVMEGHNVNIYLGQGVYMAPGSGWNNIDEMKNRYLNMEMYPRIDGSAIYKYTYLANDGGVAQLVRGNNLLKNDYWSKFVPGSVVRSYQDRVPSIKVSNIQIANALNNNSNLSWSEIANVRGYMVYQVPKKQELNTENIDHVYQYIQTNTITVPNIDDYDYYISSVNQANVISEPVRIEEAIQPSVEGIINGINNLNTPITMADEAKINLIRTFYDALSSADKLLVTNYDLFVSKESELNALIELRTALHDITDQVPHQVIMNYNFPTGDNSITWQYKNESDAVIHDLGTGMRLQERIKYTPITLIATIQLNGKVYSEEIVVNFGIVKENETGLFYRNDPSALSKDEDGDYKVTSHIGWSGKTLVYNNKVFFIAVGNYFKLTTNTIPTTHWHSCGTVYHNVSNGDLTFRLGDTAIRTDVETYGYLIMDENGDVRVSSTDTNSNTMITLHEGEILFAPHYLDSQLSNATFVPVTKAPVGSNIKFVDYDLLRTDPSTQAAYVIDLIDNLLPVDQITTETPKAPFIEARAAYNNLSQEAKDLVTNIQKLNDAEAKFIEVELTALNNAKASANNNLDALILRLNEYSASNQAIINDIISSARNSINGASTIQMVNSSLNNAVSAFNAILTLEEELAILIEYRGDAKQDLSEYVSEDNYLEDDWSSIQSIITNANNQIDSSMTANAIDSILNLAKTAIDEIFTKKDHAKQEIIDYLDIDLYNETDHSYLNSLVTASFTLVDEAKTDEKLVEIVENFKAWVDNVEKKPDVQLENAKQKAKTIIINHVKLNQYSDANQAIINTLIDNANAQIDNALSKEEINDIVALFKSDIKGIAKNQAAFWNCNNSLSYFYSFIALLTVLTFVLRRKK